MDELLANPVTLQVVWCCMTMNTPLLPVMAAQDPALNNMWTYGDPINTQQYIPDYGQELCEMVSSCLAVKPGDRPSLTQLRTDLDNVAPGQLAQKDREWLTRYMSQPSRPSARSLDRAFL